MQRKKKKPKKRGKDGREKNGTQGENVHVPTCLCVKCQKHDTIFNRKINSVQKKKKRREKEDESRKKMKRMKTEEAKFSA